MFPLVQILHEVGYEITGSDVNEGDIIDRERKLGIPDLHGTQGRKRARSRAGGVYRRHHEGQPGDRRGPPAGYPHRGAQHPSGLCGQHLPPSHLHLGHTRKNHHHGYDNADHGDGSRGPAAVIGGKLPLIDAYGRYGTGREIVVEACEYSNTFLHLVPYISVLLNVDADHLEFFKTMENLEESFRKFALLTTHTVIANLDDANTVKVIHNLDRHIRTIGIDTPADYRAVHVREYRPSFFCFDVQVLGVPAVHIELSVPGRHNVYNALAAFACATMSGCTADECARGINAFRGRRPPL